MVEFQPSKLAMRVRFPLPAPAKKHIVKDVFFYLKCLRGHPLEAPSIDWLITIDF